MVPLHIFNTMALDDKIKLLYEQGVFVVGIRYYQYKVNLYLLNHQYVEVFFNHKKARIEKIELMDTTHSRMKFYADQIKLPTDL